jgi:hypothetical protein
MRCLSCNVLLTDYEATRRYTGSQGFVDLCNHCFSTVEEDILVTERADLKGAEESDTDNLVD